MTTRRCDIAITGYGLVSCLGPDAASAWRSVLEGRRAMRPFTRCESALPPERTGGEAPDPPDHVLPGEVRETRLLRVAIDEALAAARPAAPPDRTAAVFGTTLHGMRRAGEFLRTNDRGALRGFLGAPVLLAALRGLPVQGPALSNCSACSSGLASAALGVTLLEAGLADAVIVGGYDPISEYAIGGFGALRLLARGDLRPFCAGRDGMKLSEAYAALVIERAPDALARGAPVLALVEGFGESSDAHHLTQPHPEGAGAARAMRDALARAGAEPREIGLIAAHATGTPGNDSSEFAALASVFEDSLPDIPAVAFKSHLGHSLGAAGAAELILSIAALRSQHAAPTANIAATEIEFPSLALVIGPPRPVPIHRTLNLSLGFGGTNACVVLSDRTTSPVAPRATAREVVITGVGVVLPGIVGLDALAPRLADPRPLDGDTGSVPEEQFAHLINARRIRRLSDYVKTTIAAAADACRDAAITDHADFMGACHAILGTMTCSTSFCEAYYREIIEKGIDAANPMLFAEGVPNAAAAHLSMALGITGSCQSIIGARTAGLDALGLARARISTGAWDRAIVSAGEEYHTLINDRLHACGLTDGTTGSCTGGGAVAFVLESRDAASNRGGRARAILGPWSAASCPGGLADSGAVSAGADAWRRIGAPPAAIASATRGLLAAIESRALRAGSSSPTVISSPAGHIAETLSVTPLAGLACLLSTGRLPGYRAPGATPPSGLTFADGSEPWHDAGVLATDPAGLFSALRVSPSPAAR